MTAVQGCFECTDWSVFRQAATKDQEIDIEDYAVAVSGYIYKCMEDVCVTKCITVRANEKPWMTAEVRAPAESKRFCF